MLAFHSSDSALHAPPTFFRRGKLIPALETPERYFVLRDALAAHQTLREAPDHGLEPIASVHGAGYLRFLQTAWERRAELDPAAGICSPRSSRARK